MATMRSTLSPFPGLMRSARYCARCGPMALVLPSWGACWGAPNTPSPNRCGHCAWAAWQGHTAPGHAT